MQGQVIKGLTTNIWKFKFKWTKPSPASIKKHLVRMTFSLRSSEGRLTRLEVEWRLLWANRLLSLTSLLWRCSRVRRKRTSVLWKKNRSKRQSSIPNKWPTKNSTIMCQLEDCPKDFSERKEEAVRGRSSYPMAWSYQVRARLWAQSMWLISSLRVRKIKPLCRSPILVMDCSRPPSRSGK